MFATAISIQTRQLNPRHIAAAQTRGARLAEQGYTCEFCEIFEQHFTITTKEGNRYKGWLPGGLQGFPEGKCSCEAFNKQGVCKHIYFAVEQFNESAWYAEQEEKAEYNAAAAAACVGAGIHDMRGPATIYQGDVLTDTIDAATLINAAFEWPVCNLCGRDYAAWDEAGMIPDTECWYCAKRRH